MLSNSQSSRFLALSKSSSSIELRQLNNQTGISAPPRPTWLPSRHGWPKTIKEISGPFRNWHCTHIWSPPTGWWSGFHGPPTLGSWRWNWKFREKYFWNPDDELLLHSSYSFWPYQWQRLGLSKSASMKKCEKRLFPGIFNFTVRIPCTGAPVRGQCT